MPTHASEHAIFILGPTAVGKSDLAVEFAERIGGEIVGADAFQVYAGLDVLSAKPAKALRKRVPHHLIGEVPLGESFSVAKYRVLAEERIVAITARGSVPIVCGGTGLYVRALTHGLAELPQADETLRAELAAKPLDELVARLHELDPAARVDKKNPRRVIRALEVCLLTGRPFSSNRGEWQTPPAVRGMIVTRERDDLHARIAARTEAMLEAGVIAVIAEVAATGDIGATASQMLGLREIQAHIAGRMGRAECIDAIALATRQYAKRQLTWFRRESGYTWVNLTTDPNPVAALDELAKRVSPRA
jgi:tRNA dimethylallyltransferase